MSLDPDTINVCLELLASFSISPMTKDADQIWERVIKAREQLMEEAKSRLQAHD